MSTTANLSAFQFPSNYLQVAEITYWHTFGLHFALVGMDSCGTTSLRWNLAQHPKVRFSRSTHGSAEDTSLTWSELGTFLLPPKQLRNRWLRFQRRDSSFRHNLSFGIYNAILWKSPVQVIALSHMHIPLILVVCSPSKRLATGLRESGASGVSGAGDIIDMETMINKVDPAEPGQLRELRKLFGRRLLVVHQESLLSKSTYDEIGHFIGVGAMS